MEPSTGFTQGAADPGHPKVQPAPDNYGLGRLVPVDPQTIWPGEAPDFTPWLQANIGVLTEALGLNDLIWIKRETAVGPFFLDLLAEDVLGRRVVIENQLTLSDHDHLGKLLVYAAGNQASTVIWIVSRIRDQHRAALHWLNKEAPEINFFGVELRVVKIGTSLSAPLFDIVVEPNGWEKEQVRKALTGVALARQDFFREVVEILAGQLPGFRIPTIGRDGWVNFKGGPFGYYSVVFSHDEMRVEVYLDTGDGIVNKALFDELFADKDAIESALRCTLNWGRLDEGRVSRLAIPYGRVDLDDPLEKKTAIVWAAGAAQRLIVTLDERLRRRAPELKRSSMSTQENRE